uniref:ANK_REP_REGION domain-containing protein n=1 Tax=Anopheles dirus TaxID=7168 RepID=A0A182NV37_9DIPT
MGAFQYLVDRTTDLYSVDEEGRNLLHMTAQNGCFFMMHCLIVKGFDPTHTNARNGWNLFHYLACNDDEDDRSSETVITLSNMRKQNSDKINKQQHALLGILAVFGEECRNKLFTKQERLEAIALLEQLEQEEKTSGIINRKVRNNKPFFKHKIFAEYFAACWMYENKDRMR